MAQKICILSYNCRGLNNDSNRKKLFLWLQEQKLDIIMLQETFCTDKLEPFLKMNGKARYFLVIQILLTAEVLLYYLKTTLMALF